MVQRQNAAALALLLLLLANPTPSDAAEIVIFGDSWGTGASRAFLDMLERHGSTATVDNVAVGGTTAESWARTPDALAAAIRANPEQISFGAAYKEGGTHQAAGPPPDPGTAFAPCQRPVVPSHGP